MRRRTAYQVLFLVGFGVAVGAFLWFVTVRRTFFDLNVYHGALNYWVHDGGQLYDYLRPRTEYGFTYPPFAALTMLPMAVLPWNATIVGSVLLTVTATGLVLYWLVAPIARGHGWTPWFAVGVAAGLAAAFEPMRETFMFGQVNALLLVLVIGDAVLLLRRGSRFGGLGIGLATAVKLTPGVFILYLLVTRRWRAAAVASGTAAAATLLAAAADPDASRIFWTEALWNTDRVGDLSYISNQSLQGMLARLDPVDPSRIVWLAAMVAALAVWAWRVRMRAASGRNGAEPTVKRPEAGDTADLLTGIALTGVVGGLISPVTWIHHLVWLIPAFVLLVDGALRAGSRTRRWALLAAAVAGYALLCSRLVWAWRTDFGGLDGFVFSNAYVWVSLALLVGLPGRVVGPPVGVAERSPRPSGPIQETQEASRRRA